MIKKIFFLKTFERREQRLAFEKKEKKTERNTFIEKSILRIDSSSVKKHIFQALTIVLVLLVVSTIM
jgi:hypothetical protein